MNQYRAKNRLLPSREVAYAYTVAMYLAQQFETNLRAFIHTVDYHAWIEFVLSEEQKKRVPNIEALVERGPLGLLIENLKRNGLIREPKAIAIFDRACEHRNTLSHNFLTSFDFDAVTSESEEALIERLHRMTADLYTALLISREIRGRAEERSDLEMVSLRELMAEVGIPEFEDVGRKYRTRKRSKPKK